MNSENKLFSVDTELNKECDEDDLVKKTFPLFSTLSLNLISDESEHEKEFFGIPPPSIKIKDAIEKCPIKIDYFKKSNVQNDTKKVGKFKDKLLSELDGYLEELCIENPTNFITDGIEAKSDISQLGMSDRQLKKLKRKERESTKGANWFNMKAPEMTEDLKNELEIIKMRPALNSKRFYKRSEMKTLPKYFEMGKVVESSLEYHNSKNIRKRNKTLVDELMEDVEFQKHNKKKYKEAIVHDKNNFKRFKKLNKIKKR